jgi:hypothetical protein
MPPVAKLWRLHGRELKVENRSLLNRRGWGSLNWNTTHDKHSSHEAIRRLTPARGVAVASSAER